MSYFTIDEFLRKHGYQAQTCYVKTEADAKTVILVDEWQDMTVADFIEKAYEKGWVVKKPSTVTLYVEEGIVKLRFANGTVINLGDGIEIGAMAMRSET